MKLRRAGLGLSQHRLIDTRGATNIAGTAYNEPSKPVAARQRDDFAFNRH